MALSPQQLDQLQTAHRLVVARIRGNSQTGQCTCGATLIAKRPLALTDVLEIHRARAQKNEARDLVRFIDAHGGKLGAFRGYQTRMGT